MTCERSLGIINGLKRSKVASGASKQKRERELVREKEKGWREEREKLVLGDRSMNLLSDPIS